MAYGGCIVVRFFLFLFFEKNSFFLICKNAFEDLFLQNPKNSWNHLLLTIISQPAITFLKLAIETLKQGLKYV